MNVMENEQTETHPKHVASVLRSDAAAWIGAITLWLYLGAILTTRGYLSVLGASPEWFDLSLFQLTSFSMFPLFGATLAATGYCMFLTSKGNALKAILGYLAWSLPATLTYAFNFLSGNPYNLSRIDSRWGRSGLVATLVLSLIVPLLLRFWLSRKWRRILQRIDELEVELKSSETQNAEADEKLERALRQNNEGIRADYARWRSDLEQATPKEWWVAIAASAFLTLLFCMAIGQAWALRVTSDPPRARNVTTGVTEEILLTDGERSLARKIVEGNEAIVYRAGDHEWVVRMRDGSIPAPATGPTTSPTTESRLIDELGRTVDSVHDIAKLTGLIGENIRVLDRLRDVEHGQLSERVAKLEAAAEQKGQPTTAPATAPK